MDTIRKELDDILPAYNKYLNNKLKFQTGETDSESMVLGFKFVCKELEDFICMLYSGTDTYKERRELQNSLKHIQKKIQSK